jgi:hypothetical protein
MPSRSWTLRMMWLAALVGTVVLLLPVCSVVFASLLETFCN